MFVAGRYTSRTMSATFDTERHHVMASLLPAYGDLLIRSTGCAPFAARSCRYASTFALYCAVEALHGVGIPAPKSSFSTMSGVAHPSVRSTALPYCASAAASIVEGSAGALGVPTLRGIFRSKAYVAAPRARTAAAHLVPPAPDCVVAASKVPGFARMGSSDGQPYSAHTVCFALMPQLSRADLVSVVSDTTWRAYNHTPAAGWNTDVAFDVMGGAAGGILGALAVASSHGGDEWHASPTSAAGSCRSPARRESWR